MFTIDIFSANRSIITTRITETACKQPEKKASYPVLFHLQNRTRNVEVSMIKLSTMQKLFGLSLILSLFTIAVGVYSVGSLSRLSDDIDTLYKVHVKGLDLARALRTYP